MKPFLSFDPDPLMFRYGDFLYARSFVDCCCQVCELVYDDILSVLRDECSNFRVVGDGAFLIAGKQSVHVFESLYGGYVRALAFATASENPETHSPLGGAVLRCFRDMRRLEQVYYSAWSAAFSTLYPSEQLLVRSGINDISQVKGIKLRASQRGGFNGKTEFENNLNQRLNVNSLLADRFIGVEEGKKVLVAKFKFDGVNEDLLLGITTCVIDAALSTSGLIEAKFV